MSRSAGAFNKDPPKVGPAVNRESAIEETSGQEILLPPGDICSNQYKKILDIFIDRYKNMFRVSSVKEVDCQERVFRCFRHLGSSRTA